MRPSAIAPRVLVYQGGEPPYLDPGWIALPQLSAAPGCPAVFGDGSHPTTRLCAAAVDWFCRQRHPEGVLDVGTGSGVLARIARARGVRTIVATDIDPVALASAKAHAKLDAHPVEIQFSTGAPDNWGHISTLWWRTYWRRSCDCSRPRCAGHCDRAVCCF